MPVTSGCATSNASTAAACGGASPCASGGGVAAAAGPAAAPAATGVPLACASPAAPSTARRGSVNGEVGSRPTAAHHARNAALGPCSTSAGVRSTSSTKERGSSSRRRRAACDAHMPIEQPHSAHEKGGGSVAAGVVACGTTLGCALRRDGDAGGVASSSSGASHGARSGCCCAAAGVTAIAAARAPGARAPRGDNLLRRFQTARREQQRHNSSVKKMACSARSAMTRR
jgi:hypothetical protein